MISWMRAYAPEWIGFVAYGYASATPIYDRTRENPSAVDASPTAYDSVGGNVIVDLHDYFMRSTSTDPDADGRLWNGMIYPRYQGGTRVGVDPATSYMSTSLTASQHAAYVRPCKTFTEKADLPPMIGEWGSAGAPGETAWISDAQAVWADAGAAIEIEWNYDVSTNTSVSPWAARPGGAGGARAPPRGCPPRPDGGGARPGADGPATR